MDQIVMAQQYIDPEELHLSLSEDNFPDLISNIFRTTTRSQKTQGTAGPPELDSSSPTDSASSVTVPDLTNNEQPQVRPAKAYAPRGTASGRKSTTSALRVRPRNGQHARELERNRHAAANYRSRQKNQLDTLLTRVREEENKMVKQRGMVYSLKEELWQLRNNLISRQQMQIFGMRNTEAAKIAIKQSLKFDPDASTLQQPEQ
jgi:hypothetical protein